MVLVTWFRGTSAAWEKKAISSGQLMSYREYLFLEKPQQYATHAVVPFKGLTFKQIEQAIIERVGVETNRGTSNQFSHFVPLGTNRDIASKFGYGPCYAFQINCILCDYKGADNIQKFFNEEKVKTALKQGNVPVFKGGNNEYLAYTGTQIQNVVLLEPQTKLPENLDETTLSKLFPKYSSDQSLEIRNDIQTTFPVQPFGLNYSLSNEPILLNGMKVIFDQPVGVYPVNLESKEEARRNGS